MQLITLLCVVPLIACCRMTKFAKQDDVALENHVIKVVTADRPVKCQRDCLDTPLCFSINVHAQKLPSGWVKCDLNNSSQTADPHDLVPKAGYRYHQMAEVEHCTVGRCIYKDALPDGWFIFDSKRLKIFPERKTWGRARKHCQSIGGELVSINSEDKNEFISLLLDPLLTNATAGHHSSDIMAHWTLDGTDVDVNLINGSTYKEEDGVTSLYLDGSGAHATTPAVDFGLSSFTIASWVKLESPVNHVSPLYADWSPPVKFLINTYESGQCLFGAYNNMGLFKPWLKAGSSPVDTWFHMAAVWNQNANEAYLFLDGQKVGTEAQTSGSSLRVNSHTVYDIGLKRDSGATFKGYVKDLMIVGSALNEEQLGNITDPTSEPSGGAWIGLNDVTTEGAFHWSDGSHVTYTKWASSQPDNKNNYQNCVEMAVDGGSWADTSCGRQLPFVCEKQN